MCSILFLIKDSVCTFHASLKASRLSKIVSSLIRVGECFLKLESFTEVVIFCGRSRRLSYLALKESLCVHVMYMSTHERIFSSLCKLCNLTAIRLLL